MASYKFPVTKTAANYVQLAGDSFYPTRRNGPALGIVLHVTAGLQDLDLSGADNSAEGTAKWAINREVSWHAGVDSDSIVPCLPSTYTGWHAKGYNSRTIGIEISNLDARWDNKPAAWVEKTLRNAAKAAAAYVEEYGFPLVRATKAQVDSAVAANRKFGFTYHSYLSDIRVDPGKTFPWERFIAMVREEMGAVAPKPPAPVPTKRWTKNDVIAMQALLETTRDGKWGPNTDLRATSFRDVAHKGRTQTTAQVRLVQSIVDVKVDGSYGPITTRAVVANTKTFQKILKVTQDGSWGPNTDKAFLAFRKEWKL